MGEPCPDLYLRDGRRFHHAIAASLLPLPVVNATYKGDGTCSPTQQHEHTQDGRVASLHDFHRRTSVWNSTDLTLGCFVAITARIVYGGGKHHAAAAAFSGQRQRGAGGWGAAERGLRSLPVCGRKKGKKKKPKSGGNQSCSDYECQRRAAAGSSPGISVRPPRSPRRQLILLSVLLPFLPSRGRSRPAASPRSSRFPQSQTPRGRDPAPPASSRPARGVHGGGGAAPAEDGAVPARPGSRRQVTGLRGGRRVRAGGAAELCAGSPAGQSCQETEVTAGHALHLPPATAAHGPSVAAPHTLLRTGPVRVRLAGAPEKATADVTKTRTSLGY
ncbi:uncharacterized protein LOC113989805 [Pipra filicauda]|uniref:Uncharacterized protein LOC113989805 n=1 Tax=Pipra filicauda TaxID=649802 RepID=A0A7R5KV76_9PASS|nr:uncharacterized protein LOC113989805 [Pipra filicauda]